ncbi:hypothetical protein G7070_00610 [Propioniciclava coleopterorum]|uniref:Uncharacterized protein n=1 Tax=Propioniciclava coleopterorum TaxID=2714937 RepID=A0A6G7Y2Y9_9ACTN|nr:DUF6191 domain-containing protein [Propioniciclava coleopterorum]QIK71056.1 hypothetical protein G7070_00610 [Propioniciclava coleopterorum]
MSFMEVFEPGLRHWREFKELQKVLVHRTDQAGSGRKPVDLESGRIVIELPDAAASSPGDQASSGSDADAATPGAD